jgi:FdhD protein
MSNRDRVESLEPVRSVAVTRVDGTNRVDTTDVAAAEEPLDVRLHGRSFAVIMRTPGYDRELAAGFLLSERVVRSADDLGAVEHCRHPDQTRAHHVVDVFLTGDRAKEIGDILDARRRVIANSSCGVCGRATIDELRADVAPLEDARTIDVRLIRDLPRRLRDVQATFEQTGGLHAAGLFGADGTLIASAEDVGRHNAVDKSVGMTLLDPGERPMAPLVLMVSGRVSFEIVQKAWIAGVPIVAAVSAPTSLAVALAKEARITLIGFMRDQRLNIYAEPGRIGGV